MTTIDTPTSAGLAKTEIDLTDAVSVSDGVGVPAADAVSDGAAGGEFLPIARPDLPHVEDYAELLGGSWGSKVLSNFGPVSKQLEAEAAE